MCLDVSIVEEHIKTICSFLKKLIKINYFNFIENQEKKTKHLKYLLRKTRLFFLLSYLKHTHNKLENVYTMSEWIAKKHWVGSRTFQTLNHSHRLPPPTCIKQYSDSTECRYRPLPTLPSIDPRLPNTSVYNRQFCSYFFFFLFFPLFLMIFYLFIY